jgi:hypothetical protein
MNASHDMHFRDRLAIVFFYDVQHLVNAELPAFFPVRIEPGIRTKSAGEYANIGGLDMEISVEIGFIAMQPFPHVIGKGANERKFSFFKKQDPLVETDPFPV